VRSTGSAFGASSSTRPVLDRSLVRLAFLIPGGLALLMGLDAALLLLGLHAPLTLDRLPQLHAPLMVFGFVGTFIVLERAVAARRWWGFAAPGLLGLGSLVMLSPLPVETGKAMLVVGMAALLGIYFVVWRRQAAAATAIQVLGALSGLSATVLWLSGTAVASLVPGMVSFLVLTIAGERLELERISPHVTIGVERLGLGVAIALAASAALSPLWPGVAYPLLSLSLIALVVWLFRFDVATRLVRSTGLPRYMAACLLSGYIWLVVAAGIWLFMGRVDSGWAYDAVVHSVFLGFVISMIMAHAPVILPAVLRKPLPYRPFLGIPVLLLHVSLVLRVVGDVRELPVAVQWGGALNETALLLFVVLAVTSVILGPPKKNPLKRQPSAAPKTPNAPKTATPEPATPEGPAQ
jgi:hypothetical protein